MNTFADQFAGTLATAILSLRAGEIVDLAKTSPWH
jgi:hypothetical protein